MQDPLCCTTSMAIGQKAFSNYNGIGIHLCYSPHPSVIPQWPSQQPPRSPQLQPPPMLAVVLDASMNDASFSSALESLTQAMGQLNPQTRLLLVVYDQVVKMVDLKTSKPQTWVVHGLNSPGASIFPHTVRAADIRATPLAHCQSFLSSTLAALRHYPHKQNLQQHLRLTAAAVDIALFLLTASIAAWDAQHKPQQQRHTPQQPQPQQQEELHAMHNARIILLTSVPNSSAPSATAAQLILQQFELQQAQQLQQMFSAIASKAESLDIPVDVITGSLAAPAAIMLQDTVTASHGRALHLPNLSPPLASNIVALAQSRFGWEGVFDVQVPAGVKVTQITGTVAPEHRLPAVAYASGANVPVVLLSRPGSATPASSRSESVAAPMSAAMISPAASGPISAGAAVSYGGPVNWSKAASAVPVISSGSRFVAVLELTRDWVPGSSFEVQVVCEWTTADGRRVRQVCNHTISVTDRLTPFIEGLDVPAVVLLMAQRLVAATAAAAVPGAGAALRAAAPPKPRSLEEGRLSVGMALSHLAQRLGQAHTSRRGVFGFGAQQVWQLPDDLIPLALSLYQLQRSSLLDLTSLFLEQQLSSTSASSSSSSSSSSDIPESASLMYGSWKMLIQQFMSTGPDAALRMVAPWLYVFDSSSGQFEVLPPLNLALEPDALAVLDCGSELIIYVGEVLQALVEGGLPLRRQDVGKLPPQQQQQLKEKGQQQEQGGQGKSEPTATAAATGSSSAVVNGTPQQQSVPDMAVAAAPAVQCAHQLIQGRVPVPAIRLIEDVAGMASLMQRLVPLHEDPVALQLLLLPHLRDLSPAEHGYLLDWHRHWAAAAAHTDRQGSRGEASGGARLAAAERNKALSFGQWYSSFGIVLRSPAGSLETGSPEIE